MALIELSALDGSRHDVGDRREKRDVVVIELVPLGRMRAEHAIGAAVMPRDRRGEPADDAMVLEQRLSRESRLRREILRDHRPAGSKRVAGLRVAGGRNMSPPDQPRLPSDAGPEQELGVARKQFEDLHQLDVDDLADSGDHLVEEILQMGLDQRPLAEPRERFLLARADAHLAIDPQTFGHVAALAEHVHGPAVLDDDGDRGFEPSLIVSRSCRHAVLQATRLMGLQALVDCRQDAAPVGRRKLLRSDRERAVQAAFGTAVKVLEIGRPDQAIGSKIPRP